MDIIERYVQNCRRLRNNKRRLAKSTRKGICSSIFKVYKATFPNDTGFDLTAFATQRNKIMGTIREYPPRKQKVVLSHIRSFLRGQSLGTAKYENDTIDIVDTPASTAPNSPACSQYDEEEVRNAEEFVYNAEEEKEGGKEEEKEFFFSNGSAKSFVSFGEFPRKYCYNECYERCTFVSKNRYSYTKTLCQFIKSMKYKSTQKYNFEIPKKTFDIRFFLLNPIKNLRYFAENYPDADKLVERVDEINDLLKSSGFTELAKLYSAEGIARYTRSAHSVFQNMVVFDESVDTYYNGICDGFVDGTVSWEDVNREVLEIIPQIAFAPTSIERERVHYFVKTDDTRRCIKENRVEIVRNLFYTFFLGENIDACSFEKMYADNSGEYRCGMKIIFGFLEKMKGENKEYMITQEGTPCKEALTAVRRDAGRYTVSILEEMYDAKCKEGEITKRDFLAGYTKFAEAYKKMCAKKLVL